MTISVLIELERCADRQQAATRLQQIAGQIARGNYSASYTVGLDGPIDETVRVYDMSDGEAF